LQRSIKNKQVPEAGVIATRAPTAPKPPAIARQHPEELCLVSDDSRHTKPTNRHRRNPNTCMPGKEDGDLLTTAGNG